jgi:hypothetical protein
VDAWIRVTAYGTDLAFIHDAGHGALGSLSLPDGLTAFLARKQVDTTVG